MSAPAAPRFAALGHQASWDEIAEMVQGLRAPDLEALSLAQLKEIIPWIPPRTVSRFSVAGPDRDAVTGIYIDTFITPDELASPGRRALGKVRDGIEAARREGASLVTLGGFTSILLEAMACTPDTDIALTTGNTLTAALIVRGVERAAHLLGRRLCDEDLLVIGATGDIGSACARCFKGRVRRLLLAARNAERLRHEAGRLSDGGPVEASTDVHTLLERASMVIAAASAAEPRFALDDCTPEAVVCDAGYPKNIRVAPLSKGRQRVFWGGMGVLVGGMRSRDGHLERFYRFPVPGAAHGCMLEAAVLALAGRCEPYSVGRGRITTERVEEMWDLAERKGVSLAPLFDSAGVWPEECANQSGTRQSPDSVNSSCANDCGP